MYLQLGNGLVLSLETLILGNDIFGICLRKRCVRLWFWVLRWKILSGIICEVGFNFLNMNLICLVIYLLLLK